MPVLFAVKTSNQELIDERRRKREAVLAEQEVTLRPHLDLLNRLKALLPPDSPDILAIDALCVVVKMADVATAKRAAMVSNWKLKSRQAVRDRMAAAPAAARRRPPPQRDMLD